MNRRSFVTALGGGCAALTVARRAHAETPPDDFLYRGWRVIWRGWREPTNQGVRLGWWEAWRHDTPGLYATTLGVVNHELYPSCVIDTSREDRSAPYHPVMHSEAQFTAAKKQACRRLLTALDTL